MGNCRFEWDASHYDCPENYAEPPVREDTYGIVKQRLPRGAFKVYYPYSATKQRLTLKWVGIAAAQKTQFRTIYDAKTTITVKLDGSNSDGDYVWVNEWDFTEFDRKNTDKWSGTMVLEEA